MPKGKLNKKYTGEFKQMVVETMRNEKLGYCETARQFELPNHNIGLYVNSWGKEILK